MSGINIPATEGEEYGSIPFEAFTPSGSVTPTRVFDPSLDSRSVAMRAPETNSGAIFIGWDNEVDLTNGYPLYPGDPFSVDLNVEAQGIFAVAEVTGDEIRIITTN